MIESSKERTVLEGIRQKVFLDRYALKGQDGKPLEDCPEQMWHRVSKGIAAVEQTTEKQIEWANKFYDILKDFQFVPGGRILTGAGTPHKVTYYNCYCIPSPPDSREGIIDTLKTMTEIMARGGGVGINFSTLRPRGSYIKTVNGTASGPCSWIQLFSVATGEVIQQGGSRRGALMAMLDDNHPDIEEFITCKKTPGWITHANLSICISDAFMNAVKNDDEWDLIWQGEVKKVVTARHLWNLICTSAWESAEPGLVFMERYNKQSNTWYYEDIHCVNPCVTGDTLIPCWYAVEPISIKELAERGKDYHVECLNKETGERKVRFGRNPRLTRKDAEVWKLTLDDGSTFRATPDHKMLLHSREERQLQDLHPGDSLASYSFREGISPVIRKVVSVVSDGREDVYNITVDNYHTVAYVTNEETRSGIFTMNCGEQGLGDWGVCNLGAINLSAFVEDGKMDYDRLAAVTKVAMRFLDNVIDATDYFIDENKETQLGTRRTGLGTMGLADAFIKMGITYGSDESLKVIDYVYGTIMSHAYIASIELASEKGPFPKFDRDKYLQGKFIQKQSQWIREGIEINGIRNAVLLTQAPTGTTSLFAGVSSGIEPVYDFAMIRRDRTGEHVMYHPLMQKWLNGHDNTNLPAYFVSSKDLTPEEHVRVQAKIQEYTDASISKTVNAPNEHTIDQVKKLYMMSYDSGCKGVTYYRDGSRDAVLTRVADEEKKEIAPVEVAMKSRPEIMTGYTIQVKAPEGKVNVTINSDEQGPLEVFVNVGKAGSDIAALSEALGRLISLTLQLPSAYGQDRIIDEICKQLRGIGGSRSVGFGENQVKSLPDAVARTLEPHGIFSKEITVGYYPNSNHKTASLLQTTDNVCPGCGSFSIVHEEGCKKCYSCGYSEC